ncbi:unnamed protein product [Prorocentrum cordatum]|uniref:Uncharacterized protein n=1 Tax=Prorocentrum cordatum TaxID=2364126 RepID=A0ABN9Q0Z7_9DINO|nr:unnamed protein product [Polarella glacialis]
MLHLSCSVGSRGRPPGLSQDRCSRGPGPVDRESRGSLPGHSRVSCTRQVARKRPRFHCSVPRWLRGGQGTHAATLPSFSADAGRWRALPAGLTYTQVAAGERHTVLLRSDGTAVDCGWNDVGQCDLPALPAGLTYTQVAAGVWHTVLLRSDGTAVACGVNDGGQCDLPALPAGLTYTADLCPALLLQVSLDGGSMVFVTIGGVERCRIRAAPTARLAVIYLQLVAEHRAGRLGPGAWRVEAILPGGRPLSSAAAEETVASAFPAAA